jgi:ABC-type branched-subunit amino acid transport system ATPase component
VRDNIGPQVPKSNKLKLVGRLTVNGKPLSAVATRVAYVQQDEIFYSQMTVRETLELTATLRLPKRLSAQERTAVVSTPPQPRAQPHATLVSCCTERALS